MNLKSIVCSSLLLLSGLSASAIVELVDGGVYRITNCYNSLVMTAPSAPGDITIRSLDEENPHQLWMAVRNADGSGYYFRDVARGTYMTSPISKNSHWVTTFTTEPDQDTMSFILNDDSLENTSIQAHGYSSATNERQDGYAHGNGSSGTAVSCWGPTADASRWTLSQISLDNEAINAYKENWLPLSIKPNRVYQFVNSARGTAFHATDGAGNVNCIQPDNTDKSQLWLTEPNPDGTGFYLRNLITGNYLNAPLRTVAYWTCTEYPVTGSTILNIEPNSETSDLFVIYPQGVAEDSQNFAHCDSENRLYSWGRAHNNSKWQANLVDAYDDAAIAAEQANWANPNHRVEANCVYHIVNISYGHALTHNDANMAVGTAADPTDESQLWIAEAADDGSGYILRNYKSGAALMSSLETSKQWSVASTSAPDPDKAVMHFNLLPQGFVFEPQSVLQYTDNKKTYGFAHEDSNSKIVCWRTNEQPSKWTFTPRPEISEADIAEKRQNWDYVISENLEGALNAIFADKTCTVLNTEYSSMSTEQIQQSPAYLALPEILRQMVLKVRSNDWSETDPTNADIHWDSEHAKKFRVQMIEPYSECDKISGMTCIQAYTNLNNITGILGDAGTTLYVMVDKSAAAGSTLYISPRTFSDNVDKLNHYTDGIELHEGLNIIPCTQDCAQMVVYYTVSTNDGRTRLRPLTDFDAIKIHIEGGSINGFFNSVGDDLYTPDTNEDWFYYRDRARHPRFCLISDHCMLYLHFDNATDNDGNDHAGLKNLLTPAEYAAGNFDLNATMKAWDDMFVAEQLVMGLMNDDVIRAEKAAGRDWYDTLEGDDIAPSDYSLYFNNRLMGITTTTGFMSATWYRTTYNITTLRSIIMEFPTMDLWGPAHEFGHMNQGPMKIAGTTEESNNVFSNIALFYRGDKTSRASLPSVQSDFFNKGYNFHQHDTWGTTRMWFQLWLYYHATGHNKKFYPRLYELLRENPLRKNSTEHLNAKDDLLHFAKMCCMAAGEDLTDFFDSWGFLVPQDGYYIGDYTSYTSYLSEEDIEEWKAEIAQLAEENGWEKNTSIIFIDDRVGSTKPGYADWCLPADAGTMGGLNDFGPDAEPVSGDYEFVLTGTTVKVNGASGGVGFIIYDETGKLIGFANDTTFEVSPAAAEKIAAGQATFNVVTGDNEEVKVIDAVREGSSETQAEIISTLLDRADAMIAKADFTNRKVGYIKPELVADLKTVRDNVKAIVDNDGLTADNTAELYLQLNSQVVSAESIALNADNTIGIEPDGIYVFTNNKLKGAYGIQPAANAQTAVPVTGANVDLDNEAQQWSFTPTTDGDTPGYYIQSISTHKYLHIPSGDTTPLPLSDEPQKFIVELHSPGFISLAADITDNHKAIHADNSNRIVRWTTGADASQWTIELIDNAEQKALLFALSDMIERSKTLLAQSGTVEVSAVDPQPVDISGDNLFTNAPCKNTSYGDQFTDQTWSYLFDDDSSTLFHSDYSTEGTSDGLNHYIRIELPAEPAIDMFILGYRTRGTKGTSLANAPAKVQLAASADAENWTEIANITSGLSSEFATDVQLPACELPSNTRYVRFMVNEATPNSTAAGHTYFAISELRIFNAQRSVAVFPGTQFTFVEPEMMLELYDEIRHAKEVLGAESSAEQLSTATEQLHEKYQILLDAMNRNSERLRDLIEQTRQLADEIGTNSEEITPLTLTTDHYSTNAEYTGSNSVDHLSTWEVLFDNNPNTIFHSNYDGNTTDGLDHYIRIELPEPTQAEETHMILTYQTRNQDNNLYAPAEAIIEYSADGQTWTTAQELDALLPTTRAANFESETFEVPAGTAHIRFTVTKSRRSVSDATSGTSNGHAYFAVSEFGLSTYNVTSVPDTNGYPDSNEKAITAALRQSRNSEIVLNAPNTTHSHYDQSYAALFPHYQTLLAIKENPSESVAIDEISTPESDATVIYDLRGMRLDRITAPGIYIINGKKVLIK